MDAVFPLREKPMTKKDRLALVAQIKEILEKDKDIAQGTKDRLMLMVFASVIEMIDSLDNKIDIIDSKVVFLEKFKPYLQVAAWASGIIGVAFLMLIWSLLTGQASLIFK